MKIVSAVNTARAVSVVLNFKLLTRIDLFAARESQTLAKGACLTRFGGQKRIDVRAGKIIGMLLSVCIAIISVIIVNGRVH